VAAEGDGYAADAAREFSKTVKSGNQRLLIVPGSEHGTRLFGSPSGDKVEKAIFEFLQRN
jgi:hypothetical protein